MRSKLTLLAVWAICCTTTSAVAEGVHCARADFKFCPNCAVQFEWKTYRNTVCTVHLYTSGVYFGQKSVKKPSHGKWGKINETQYAYIPDKNFFGRDHFSFRIEYENRGSRVYSDVDVDMAVE